MDLDAMYKLTHGLYVLGASDNGKPVGSLVDAVMQVANKPIAIALSCTKGSYTRECIERTSVFSLSVLCKDVNPFVVANFGYQSSRKTDKWKAVKYYMKDGLPYLEDNLAVFRCQVLHHYELESNTLFVAEVTEAADNKNGEPLTYLDYRSYFRHEVMASFQNYQMENKTMAEDSEKKWVCTVCGYVYDGDVPFEDLPDDYICPLCGVGKDLFELQ